VWEALQRTIAGEVLTPESPGYEAARKPAIARFHDVRPAAVVRCRAAEDVLAAAAVGLPVAARSGGHCFAGRSTTTGVVIDVGPLDAVSVADGVATIGAGARLGAVYDALLEHGVTIPAGCGPEVGIAGLTLGGGLGIMGRRHGLTSDSLVGATVALGGRLVQCDEEREPELFWALRGGGGNFGVVTSFTFRLHPVGPLVLGGMFAYAVSAAPEVLGVLAELHESYPGDFGGAAAFLTAPPAPFVPGDVVGRPVLAVIPAWFGDLDAGFDAIRPLKDRLAPLIDAVAPMPYVALQTLLDAGSPKGLRNRWSGGFVHELSGPLVSDLQDAAMRMPSPLSQIIISPLPEAVRALPDDATAFPARNGGRWLVHPVGLWAAPADDAANVAWVTDLRDAVRRHGETGSYLNLDDPDDARIRWAMGDARYRRLQRVKAAWDPEDVFHHCTHIAPGPGR
jgi:FAD/FMN-containing dehydrogenase